MSDNCGDKCDSHSAIESAVKDFKDTVKDIHREIKEMSDCLSAGDAKFQTLALRVVNLERIVYGTVGAVLLAVVGSVIALVLR